MARRRNLLDLSAQERQQLAALMLQYIKDAIVRVHAAGHDWHHPNNVAFFVRHREYINGLELFFFGNGNSNFVPLLKWDPATRIPAEFNVVKPTDSGIVRPALINLNPNMPKPRNLNPPAICSFGSGNALASATTEWHDNVHGSIGGSMSFIPHAPAAPIFWCWHAFVDDIYDGWLSCPLLILGDPYGYIGNAARVVARGQDLHIHELYLTDRWYHFDMTGIAGAVPAAGDPMGYVAGAPRVIYRGQDSRIHELYLIDRWYHWAMVGAR
jgi:hypothetical protein